MSRDFVVFPKKFPQIIYLIPKWKSLSQKIWRMKNFSTDSIFNSEVKIPPSIDHSIVKYVLNYYYITHSILNTIKTTTACGGFDVSNKSDFLAERYVFILHNYVRTNLLNKTILSCDCLSVHELKKQWSVCPWDEEPQALSACLLHQKPDSSQL